MMVKKKTLKKKEEKKRETKKQKNIIKMLVLYDATVTKFDHQ